MSRTSGSTAPPLARDRWLLALIAGFVVMIAVNAFFIYVAVNGSDPVVPSYRTEAR
jgi:hypothetical protein